MHRLPLVLLLASLCVPATLPSPVAQPDGSPAARQPAVGVRAAPRPAAVAATSNRYKDVLLIILAGGGGMRLSLDRGHHWQTPRGLAARGTFFGVVADPSHNGVAYAVNGDLYRTTNGGQRWQQAPPPRGLGVTYLTVVAVDPEGQGVYAAGTRVLIYRADGRWQVFGRGWPANVTPMALLAVPGQGLYAAAGDRLYHVMSADAPWLTVPAPPWQGASITALALGPDGKTPYVAVRGRGVWRVAGGVQPVNGKGLPARTSVYTLQSDPANSNLYAATPDGLYARPLLSTGSANALTPWYLAVSTVGSEGMIMSLQLEPLRRVLLAVARNGALYEGMSRRWQGPVLSGQAPVVAALTGAAWQSSPVPAQLPAPFRVRCQAFAPPYRPDETFDVCGPFKDFYRVHNAFSVLGYPREQAARAGNGAVTQRFEKGELVWTPGHEVTLAALGKAMAGGRVFRRPTRAEIAKAVARGTVIIGPYYVDPLFYNFWRQYTYNSGASIFGPPISQLLTEPSTDGTGARVRVQYFVNVRLEYHENAAAPIQLSYLRT